MEVSVHAYNRINERVCAVFSRRQANKIAEEAYKKGYCIEQLQPEYKYLAEYLSFKLKGESDRTEVRLYKECLWFWNGRKRTLRTVYPIYKSIPIAGELKKLRKWEEENGRN